jgi:hypothetical protein
MSSNKVAWLLVLLAIGIVAVITQAQSQPTQPDQARPAPTAAERAARIDQFRQQFTDQVKDSLAASDDEWKVIQPKLAKVMQLRQEAMMSMIGRVMRVMRRTRGADAAAAEPATLAANASGLEKAAFDLETLLSNKDSKKEAIKVALAEYRKARDAAKADLDRAQAELKDLLTIRQEAILVSQSILD